MRMSSIGGKVRTANAISSSPMMVIIFQKIFTLLHCQERGRKRGAYRTARKSRMIQINPMMSSRSSLIEYFI